MKLAQTRPNIQTLLRPLLISLAGVAALSASSHISVPMYPVPMTMQTLVVLMLGALMGPRAGAARRLPAPVGLSRGQRACAFRTAA